jgi:pantoate--beta-alanine ligase
LFIPHEKDVYPIHFTPIEMHLGSLEDVFEGEHREGHFNGVVQVLYRFFKAIKPDYAVFGEKDYQQCLVVQKLVHDFFPEITLIFCPTIRLGSGLALSSRNERLSPEGIKNAAHLYKSLVMARVLVKTQPIPSVIEQCREYLEDKGFEVDYFDIVDDHTLEPLDLYHEKKAVSLVAAKLQNVRLIDNLRF